jgi:sugar phosphate isomerase/epimerase
MLQAPRFSISEFTTLRGSFADDLAAYAAVGAGGIGICEFKLADGDERRLYESGLRANVCVPAVPSILPLPLLPGPDDPEERITSLCASIGRLAKLDPVAVMFLTGPGPERRDVVVEGVKRLAAAADAAGVVLAIEPFHSSQSETFSFVNTIDDARTLLADADADTVRLLFDTWHLGDAPGIEEQIAEHAASFATVHVADRREPTRNDFDRLVPGDGVLPLPRLLAAIDRAGYDAFYEVEIFSDDGTFGHALPDALWALPVDEAARRVRAGFDRVWEAAGTTAPTSGGPTLPAG